MFYLADDGTEITMAGITSGSATAAAVEIDDSSAGSSSSDSAAELRRRRLSVPTSPSTEPAAKSSSAASSTSTSSAGATAPLAPSRVGGWKSLFFFTALVAFGTAAYCRHSAASSVAACDCSGAPAVEALRLPMCTATASQSAAAAAAVGDRTAATDCAAPAALVQLQIDAVRRQLRELRATVARLDLVRDPQQRQRARDAVAAALAESETNTDANANVDANAGVDLDALTLRGEWNAMRRAASEQTGDAAKKKSGA